MKKEESKYKHLTLDDRIEMQECLSKGMTFKDIAKRILKDPTTVSKEVKLHLQLHKNGFSSMDGICPHLLKAPFVCNGCAKRSNAGCKYTRRLYLAKQAQAAYEHTLIESRTGIPLNKESFYETEAVISNAIRKGQHIYHAIKTNNLPISCSTIYKHIKKGYYTIAPMDLPRAVKFKERKADRTEYVPKWAKEGRTYDDYLAFIKEHDSIPTVQIDTVIGRIGGKAILTVHFPESDFTVALLVDNKTAASCAKAIIGLKENLQAHGYAFGEIIPIILTDNGGEFSNVAAFETNLDGNKETRMFFCDAYASYEKPHIEKNHTMLRDILPKGTSFDDLTQEQINLVFSHVNAVKRKKFNGKSAYDMFTFTYSKELATVLGIEHIPANKVIQSTALLK